MIFREQGINKGCNKLEIEFEDSDSFEEREVAYKSFEYVKAILQLHNTIKIQLHNTIKK